MANLISELLDEMNRVRDLIKEYESLPDGAGFFGASIMKASIHSAEEAIKQGDVVKELAAYEKLKSHTG